MSDTNELLHLILERINTLEKAVVAAIPRSRRSRKMQKITVTANELLDARVKKVTELFHSLIAMDLGKRSISKFPSYLMESGDEPNFGAVTEAILVNRASMLLLFKPVAVYNETSANDTARAAVREAASRGAFVVTPLCDSGIRVDAEYRANRTMIVMTHACARKWTAVGGGEPPRRKIEEKVEPKLVAVEEQDDGIWRPIPVKTGMCKIHKRELDPAGECWKCLLADAQQEGKEQAKLYKGLLAAHDEAPEGGLL